ncbi:MAG TPA: zf-HC2 domain-containing protein [Pirellulales bacterium]|nr:zf-HC2 domain-containing protein [Pirellulales bacterium]
MDCQQVLSEVERLVDGELPAAERAALEAHLAECEGCRAARDAARLDDAALLRAFLPRRRAAAALADRVVAELRREQGQAPIEPALRHRWRSWAVPLVAAAAGFLLAVLVLRPPFGRWLPFGQQANAPSRAALPLGRLAVATGPTEMRTAPTIPWTVCPPSGEIEAGAAVRTADFTRCEIEANNGAQLRLDAGTVIELPTPGCVRLSQGELYSAIPGGSVFKCEAQGAVVEVEQGKFDVSCSPGSVSLTVIEGSATLECKSGTRQVAAGERVRLADGHIEETAAVANPLQDTSWINELLVLKGPDNPELAERLNDILAQLGQAKLSYLYEDEIRRLGSRAALPLLRYAASPRSRTKQTSRAAAVRIAADLADSSVVGDLIGLLDDGDPQVRVDAARALERLTGVNQGRPSDAWREDLDACRPTVESWRTWWHAHQANHGRSSGGTGR